MKAHIKIPNGWRRVRKGQIIQARDRWLVMAPFHAIWRRASWLIGMEHSGRQIFIRRIKRKGAK